jgi:hypothetical protein
MAMVLKTHPPIRYCCGSAIRKAARMVYYASFSLVTHHIDQPQIPPEKDGEASLITEHWC